jgi:cell division protein FtsI/penicillin-binding protein 2
MKLREKKWIRFRIYLVAIFFIIGLGTVLTRAYQLQILEKDHLEKIARSGYIGIKKIPSKRGTIYDRNGHELALSVKSGSVYAHPNRIKDKDKTARQLSNILGESYPRISRLLKSRRPFVWIKRKIAADLAQRIRNFKLEGIGVTDEMRRYYPGKEIAAHLIGFVGSENQGLEGLEKKYDEILTGPQNTIRQMRDALLRSFSISEPISSEERPCDLVLTIDKGIQYKAQEYLLEFVQWS